MALSRVAVSQRCLPRSVSARKPAPARMRATSDQEQPVLLPGAMWLSKDASSMPLYGPSFIIPRDPPAEPTQLTQQECLDVSLSAALGSSLPLVFSRSSGCSLVQVAVDPPASMVVFEESDQQQEVIDVEPIEGPAGTPFIAPSGAGSSLQLPDEQDQSFFETTNTFSPRRTQKVKFTCNICGSTNVKPINPHAWRSGSVFARCSKCSVTHKLIDNLKIFHEYSGPLFNPSLRIKLPPGLPNPLAEGGNDLLA